MTEAKRRAETFRRFWARRMLRMIHPTVAPASSDVNRFADALERYEEERVALEKLEKIVKTRRAREHGNNRNSKKRTA